MAGLIPRTLLFVEQERSAPQLSPRGRRLAWLEGAQTVGRVCVRGIESSGGVAVADMRGVRALRWLRDGSRLLLDVDPHASDAPRLMLAPLDGGEARTCAGGDGAEPRLVALTDREPGEALVALNDRDPEVHDLYRLDLASGTRTLVPSGGVAPLQWIADRNLRARACVVPCAGGGFALLHRSADDVPWTERYVWPEEDALSAEVYGYADDDRTLYVGSAAGRPTTALIALDTHDHTAEQVVAADPQYDVAKVLRDPLTLHPDAVVYERERRTTVALRPELAAELTVLEEACAGDLDVVDRSRDDRLWVFADVRDDRPPSYSLWRRDRRESELLHFDRPALADYALATTRSLTFTANDALKLHAYLTLPPDARAAPLAAVVRVHGGPWQRDTRGFSPEVQWLANRGYACLQINFRGSTGYGKALLNAGDREWGGAIQDDLAAGARHLIDTGVAVAGRVAIFGSSFGGFSAVSGLVRTPDMFACAVSLMGPIDLQRFVGTVPPAWSSLRQLLHRRVGDPVADAEMLREHSPRFHVDRLRAPLLIAQGALDRRVPVELTREFVGAIRATGGEVEYLEFDDEGHGFTNPANALRFYAAAERFLARHLGGCVEPELDPEPSRGGTVR